MPQDWQTKKNRLRKCGTVNQRRLRDRQLRRFCVGRTPGQEYSPTGNSHSYDDCFNRRESRCEERSRYGTDRGLSTANLNFSATLVLSLAGFSLPLAAVRFYGVHTYLGTQRMGEIGIHMTLGAPR
jgi:hypothetical protein